MGAAPTGLDGAGFAAFVLSPEFFSWPNRFAEAAGVFFVSGLLAFAAWRARGLVRRRLTADRDRAAMQEAFGQYVPSQIVNHMRRGGSFEETARDRIEATMLYLDIKDFTRMTSESGGAEVVAVLSTFFEACAETIERHNGSVINLNGDALLAAFNTPLANEDHAASALRCALELLRKVDQESFMGRRLRIRIGVATGDVAAGPVGGRRRRAYTVHGDAVNLAARLEALCKEHKTKLLISGDTADLLGGQWRLKEVGTLSVRGRSDPVAAFTAFE